MFNTSVEDNIETAKTELLRVMPTVTEEQQVAIKKAVKELDKGLKAIATRQKHIKIADRSELGWGVIAAYESDKLVDDFKDEKRLFKAEKEAERRQQKRKRKQNPPAGVRKRVPEPEVPGGRGGGGAGGRPPPARPRLIGPCYRCGEFGHLVANCSKPRPTSYPFDQPLVSEAADSVACLMNVSDNREGVPGSKYQSPSVNAKSLRELCKLAIPSHGTIN